MRVSSTIAIFCSILWSINASAQSMSDLMNSANSTAQGAGVSETPSSDQRARCAGGDGLTRQASIRSCGRVIGERISLTDTATAYYYRASHYEELGDTEHARADFQRAIEVFTQTVRADRTHANPIHNRGLAYARMNEFDRAMADYQAAATLSPEWDAPHRSIGYVHFRRGNYQAAVASFDRAIALDPEDANNLAARCEGLAALRSFADAENACAEALRVDESATNYAHVAIGFLKFMQGDFAAAFTAFDEAAQHDSSRSLAFYGRGMSALRLGRQAEGEADIAHATALGRRSLSLYANAGMSP